MKSARLAVLWCPLVVVLALGGCAPWWRATPAPTTLPLPSRPALVWSACYSALGLDRPDRACITWADADRLLKWDDQWRAFEAAWKRLQPAEP